VSWITIRKTPCHLYISYGHTWTDHLYGSNIRVRTDDGFQISLDLNPNLRVKNKATDQYDDAKALANGDIAFLNYVELKDDYTLKGIGTQLLRLSPIPKEWLLVLELNGTHTFKVRPEYERHNALEVLRLRVIP